MCFDLSRFVDQPLASKLVCSICQGVLCCPQVNQNEPSSKQEPVNGNKGGHKFCEKCIREWLNTDKSCPNCRKKLNFNQLQPLDWFSHDILKGLKIWCIYKKHGCKYSNELQLIQNHEASCEFGFKTCKTCNLCVSILQNHTEIDCINHLKNLMKNKDDEIERLKKNLNVKDEEIVGFKNQIEHMEDRIEELENEDDTESEELENEDDTESEEKSMQLLDLCHFEDNYEKVKEIIQEGDVNVNFKSADGRTALIVGPPETPTSLPSTFGHLNIVRLLIQSGANLNEQESKDGNTALICASDNGHYEVAELLICIGADIDKQNNKGITALIKATMSGEDDIVDLLLDKDAEIDVRDKYGNTALIEAAFYGELEIAKLLVENNADINIRNNNGKTARQIANRKKNHEISQFLESYNKS